MNVFELEASLNLNTDGFDEGLRRATSGLDQGAESGSRFGDVLKGSLAASAITKGLDLLANGMQKVVGITKESVMAFASYEQLSGGIETLYKSSADTVMKYADQAYQTAGMSANQYMETATSFAASLVSSLGGDTERAAEYANTAITDMSDNANKMGTDMESLQYAYNGFAKQNFTMLDNLKLGYGGTKEEMQRLLDDAEKIKASQGEVADYSIDSYADIVEAIHTVQTEMDITGTTAAEASETIEGSLSSAKSAWENLLTGLANGDADVGSLFDTFFSAVETAASNIIPAVGTALSNIGSLIMERGPELAQKGVDLILKLGQGIANGIPQFIAKLPAIIVGIVNFISNNLPKIVSVGLQIVTAIGRGLIQAIPQLVAAAPQIISTLLSALISAGSMLVSAGLQLLQFIKNGLISAAGQLMSAAGQLVQRIKNGLISGAGQLMSAGLQLVQKIAAGVRNGINHVLSVIRTIISRIKSVFTGGGWASIGSNIVKGIASGILGGVTAIAKAAKSLAGKALSAFKEAFSIHSPSRLFRDEIGKNIGLGVAEGIEDSEDESIKAAKELAEKTYSWYQEWLRRKTKFDKLPLLTQLKAWEDIQAKFNKESKQWIQAEEEIFDLREKIISDFSDTVEEKWKSIWDANEKYKDALADRIDQIAGAYSVFDDVQDRAAVSGAELTENLMRQVNVLDDFYGGLDRLAGRGVSQALLDEIRGMGPKAVDELDALLDMTDDELDEYAGLYERKLSYATKVATAELSDQWVEMRQEMEAGMDSIMKLYNKTAPFLGESFTEGLVKRLIGEAPDVVFAHLKDKLTQEAWRNSLQGREIPFSQSGVGMSSAGIINTVASSGQAGGPVTINLMTPDGGVLAKYLFDPLKNYAAAKGQPIVNPA